MSLFIRLRAKLARGEERRGRPGPQPPAANMRQMVTTILKHENVSQIVFNHPQVWDEELATVAQAHADQCKFAHDCADCRRVDR